MTSADSPRDSALSTRFLKCRSRLCLSQKRAWGRNSCLRSVVCKTIRERRFGLWLYSWLIFLCLPLYGIDRDQKLAELYHTAWTFKDGAPAEIWALAQTTDGFLWLGTATGLFRFDGIRFEPYKPRSGKAFPQPVWPLFSPSQMEAFGWAIGTEASASLRTGR